MIVRLVLPSQLFEGIFTRLFGQRAASHPQALRFGNALWLVGKIEVTCFDGSIPRQLKLQEPATLLLAFCFVLFMILIRWYNEQKGQVMREQMQRDCPA
jgi:hypothetical protein